MPIRMADCRIQGRLQGRLDQSSITLSGTDLALAVRPSHGIMESWNYGPRSNLRHVDLCILLEKHEKARSLSVRSISPSHGVREYGVISAKRQNVRGIMFDSLIRLIETSCSRYRYLVYIVNGLTNLVDCS